MKKLLSIVLLVVLMLNISCVFAETTDLTQMSDEDLLQLRLAIIQELSERKILPSFTAPIGIYEAGKDFPVGRYCISPERNVTYINIYENSQMYEEGVRIGYQDTLFAENGTVKVFEFTQGMIVDVSIGNAHFEPFYGLSFE